jgi:hypothetical protein
VFSTDFQPKLLDDFQSKLLDDFQPKLLDDFQPKLLDDFHPKLLDDFQLQLLDVFQLNHENNSTSDVNCGKIMAKTFVRGGPIYLKFIVSGLKSSQHP